MADDAQAEVEKLRAEVERLRQRELDDLRAQLTTMREERDNYRAEAHRIAEVGRKIAADYEKRLTECRTKLSLYTSTDVSRDGIGRTQRGGH
jgi:hypothetical protein